MHGLDDSKPRANALADAWRRGSALALPHEMIASIAEVLWLFAPLLVSAALSAIVIRFDLVRALKRPIDGGRTFRGRRLFGDSKTWRGVATAVVGCIVTATVQRLIDPSVPSPLLFGGLMGLGAMAGELPNSFVKRQRGIAPGKTARGPERVLFYVWDQIDLMIGAWPLIAYWVRPTPGFVALSFFVALALHPLVAAIGFLLGARKSAR